MKSPKTPDPPLDIGFSLGHHRGVRGSTLRPVLSVTGPPHQFHQSREYVGLFACLISHREPRHSWRSNWPRRAGPRHAFAGRWISRGSVASETCA
jgi:hypothetical protein